jgi:hypothetical protein
MNGVRIHNVSGDRSHNNTQVHDYQSHNNTQVHDYQSHNNTQVHDNQSHKFYNSIIDFTLSNLIEV